MLLNQRRHPSVCCIPDLASKTRAPCLLQAKELLKEAGASDKAAVLGGATIAGFIASAFRCCPNPSATFPPETPPLQHEGVGGRSRARVMWSLSASSVNAADAKHGRRKHCHSEGDLRTLLYIPVLEETGHVLTGPAPIWSAAPWPPDYPLLPRSLLSGSVKLRMQKMERSSFEPASQRDPNLPFQHGVLLLLRSLPFDFVKTRMQKMERGPDGKYPYAGPVDCAMQTFKNEVRCPLVPSPIVGHALLLAGLTATKFLLCSCFAPAPLRIATSHGLGEQHLSYSLS